MADENRRIGMRPLRSESQEPAMRRPTQGEREYQWREWACTLACETSKSHPDWNTANVMHLAGAMLDMIIHGLDALSYTSPVDQEPYGPRGSNIKDNP